MKGSEKTEKTTHLCAGKIVGKDDPRIEFRGRLDSLAAEIVELQVRETHAGRVELAEELEEVREKIYDLILCEVTGSPCEEPVLWGLSADELRERSHYPEKYFGIGHIRAHYSMGEAASGLNLLRTKTREAELSACRASEPTDIVLFLNRLSSAFYVLTYKYLPVGYDKTVRFGKS